MAMTVTLSSVLNPDFPPGQRGATVSPTPIACSDIADASRICREFLTAYGLGGGNWTGGQIRDASGDLIARVSYNGRVWGNDGREIRDA